MNFYCSYIWKFFSILFFVPPMVFRVNLLNMSLVSIAFRGVSYFYINFHYPFYTQVYVFIGILSLLKLIVAPRLNSKMWVEVIVLSRKM